MTDETAVLNVDIPEYDQVKKVCLDKGLKVVSYGRKGTEIQLVSQKLYETGQKLSVVIFGKKYDVDLPVAGNFQGINVLAAIGLVLACGFKSDDVINTLKTLKSPSGRMELVA